MTDDHDSTAIRLAFRRRLADTAWDLFREHYGKLLSALGGVAFGACTAYVGIWTQISDAKHAAHDALAATTELKASIKQLVTERELDDARDRINVLEQRLDYATKEAGTSPVPRKHRQ